MPGPLVHCTGAVGVIYLLLHPILLSHLTPLSSSRISSKAPVSSGRSGPRFLTPMSFLTSHQLRPVVTRGLEFAQHCQHEQAENN